jgi:hypothetical protein
LEIANALYRGIFHGAGKTLMVRLKLFQNRDIHDLRRSRGRKLQVTSPGDQNSSDRKNVPNESVLRGGSDPTHGGSFPWLILEPMLVRIPPSRQSVLDEQALFTDERKKIASRTALIETMPQAKGNEVQECRLGKRSPNISCRSPGFACGSPKNCLRQGCWMSEFENRGRDRSPP